MRKHVLPLFGLLLVAGFSLMSTAQFPDTKAPTSMDVTVDADNTCTLKVKTRHGGAAASVKVSTDVSGGISCSGGRSFYTDSDGEVTLRWVSGCKLRNIYVDGRGYEVDYRDGGSYTITMK